MRQENEEKKKKEGKTDAERYRRSNFGLVSLESSALGSRSHTFHGTFIFFLTLCLSLHKNK